MSGCAADGVGSMAAAAMGMANTPYSPVETHRLTVAYNNLGSLLKMQGQMVAAISCFEAVCACVYALVRVCVCVCMAAES